MAYCKICGDESNLSRPIRFWDCDDGWRVGCLCQWCHDSVKGRKPLRGDYAYDKRGQYVADADEAIDSLCD